MKYRVELPGGGPALTVDLPALHPGEPAHATVNGRTVEVLLLEDVGGESALRIDGEQYLVRELPGTPAGEPGGLEVRFLHRGFAIRARVEGELDRLKASLAAPPSAGGPYLVQSALPGVVRRVLTSPGAAVEATTPLFTLEAMKMENEVRAGRRGRVAEVFVAAGQVVEALAPLARIEPLPGS